MREIKEGLLELAKQEQAVGMLKYGLHNSHHEAYAVLKEELDEMGDAAALAMRAFDTIWEAVKNNQLSIEEIHRMQIELLHMGAELVQCLSVLNKWCLLFEDPRVDERKDQD